MKERILAMIDTRIAELDRAGRCPEESNEYYLKIDSKTDELETLRDSILALPDTDKE